MEKRETDFVLGAEHVRKPTSPNFGRKGRAKTRLELKREQKAFYMAGALATAKLTKTPKSAGEIRAAHKVVDAAKRSVTKVDA